VRGNKDAKNEMYVVDSEIGKRKTENEMKKMVQGESEFYGVLKKDEGNGDITIATKSGNR
jgi:hypothetical protein